VTLEITQVDGRRGTARFIDVAWEVQQSVTGGGRRGTHRVLPGSSTDPDGRPRRRFGTSSVLPAWSHSRSSGKQFASRLVAPLLGRSHAVAEPAWSWAVRLIVFAKEFVQPKAATESGGR
jgi:hypothetical protein